MRGVRTDFIGNLPMVRGAEASTPNLRIGSTMGSWWGRSAQS